MCFGLSTLGAGAKTRLESRIKEFTPHYPSRIASVSTASLAVEDDADVSEARNPRQ